MPLVSAFRWDTGVQVHAGNDRDRRHGVGHRRARCRIRWSRDDNGGRQIAGRVALHPVAGLIVGGSAARGAFVSQTRRARGARRSRRGGDFTQTAWGADVEYSRDYYLVRVETVVSRWTLPLLSGAARASCRCRPIATSAEGRYKIRPGLYVAARLDHLGFSEVATGRTGDRAGMRRSRACEVGGGYSIQRNLVLKLAYQRNAATAAECTRPQSRRRAGGVLVLS